VFAGTGEALGIGIDEESAVEHDGRIEELGSALNKSGQIWGHGTTPKVL